MIVVVVAAALWGCGGPEPSPEPPGARDTTGPGPESPPPAALREPDSPAPAAPVCAFQRGDHVTFEILDGIPNPRCARALEGQTLALTNGTGERLSFNLGGGPVTVDPGATWRLDQPVGEWLAPGVHVIAMPFYAGSGPELWVQDSSVVRIEGTVAETFVSARAIVVETGAGTRNVALDKGTRILDAAGVPSSPEDFSLILSPGTQVSLVADMESADTGTALQIHVVGNDE